LDRDVRGCYIDSWLDAVGWRVELGEVRQYFGAGRDVSGQKQIWSSCEPVGGGSLIDNGIRLGIGAVVGNGAINAAVAIRDRGQVMG
jgi:hypothetical protein